jgi:deoxyribodipyrimidine photo-lyase
MFNNPHTDKDYYAPRFKEMRYDKPGKAFVAWCEGKTGFPFVDAAMRQLLQEGWMHNRTRMVVASFLVKDLHLEWQHGAKFFEEHLVDFDVASNAHGWQWTAGTGTDASPYYRVFNPIEQGTKVPIFVNMFPRSLIYQIKRFTNLGSISMATCITIQRELLITQ